MSNQYFENNENLTSQTRDLTFYFKGYQLFFISDNGVFSKNNVDYGSSLLLKTMIDVEKFTNILDVGCGYGVIGITLAKILPQSFVDMIDINYRAIDLARKNSLKNKVENCHIFYSNGYREINKTYDLIVSNPPIRAGKEVVKTIVIDAFDHLNDSGEMWCVIRKNQGAESYLKMLKTRYKLVEIVEKDKGYFIIKAKK